jgi:hypothetical protein
MNLVPNPFRGPAAIRNTVHSHPRKAVNHLPNPWWGCAGIKPPRALARSPLIMKTGASQSAKLFYVSKGLTSMSKTRHANAVVEVRTNAGVVVKPRG